MTPRPKTYLRDFDVPILAADGETVTHVITIQVEVWQDESGEEILTPESLELIDSTQARHMGIMLPEEIRALRRRLGLTQAEIASLLQIGEKSYTRWESGKARPSRSVNVILHALRDGRIDAPWLRSLAKPDFNWRPKVIGYDFASGERAATFTDLKPTPPFLNEASATAA
jgi:DNA-binding transcriptional regulator YiaG